MRVLVTGSSGHLGEALVRTLRDAGRDVVGLDVLASPYTTIVASIADREAVRRAMDGVDAVLHAATLHKPHVATHAAQAFVDTNVTGTLCLLEAAAARRVKAFVFTSTTSVFGRALSPPEDAPAAWVTEDLRPVPKNIYGVTKHAAEDLCELFHRLHGLPCLVLRTSRFFPEDDDEPDARAAFDALNLKTIELLNRRADIQDVVDAHLVALERAPERGFGRYIVTATTPLREEDCAALRLDAARVLARRVPGFADVFASRGWRMAPSLDRVYVNTRARRDLGWEPRYDFARALEDLAAGKDPRSPLARAIGAKGYHRA